MKTSSEDLRDTSLLTLVKRMEGIIELYLNAGETIVGTTIVPIPGGGFHGIIFHAKPVIPTIPSIPPTGLYTKRTAVTH